MIAPNPPAPICVRCGEDIHGFTDKNIVAVPVTDIKGVDMAPSLVAMCSECIVKMEGDND